MPSTLFFNGRLTAVPGAVSKVDASALEKAGLGASGIVAVVGTAEGGVPVSAMTKPGDAIRLVSPGKEAEYFRSGDLREVMPFIWAPSTDADITGGAQEIVAVKVNPALQSSGVLVNAAGDALDLTSEDYGEHTKQINVEVADGTDAGTKLVSISFEDTLETQDNLGGDTMFSLTYDAGTDGWDTTATGQVIAGGHVVVNGSRAETGKDGDITQPLAASVLTVTSDNAADVGILVDIWGLDGVGAVLKETLTTNGTTPVTGTTSFTEVLAAKARTALAGTLDVDDDDPVTLLTLTGTTPKGGVVGQDMYANGVVTVVADAATTADLIVEGLNASGSLVREKITLSGTTPVAGAVAFTSVTFVALGVVEAARTATLSAEMARADASVQTTLQKAADYFNARKTTHGGFTFTIVTSLTSFVLTDLDVMTAATSILDPTVGTFKADLWAVKSWINLNSGLITAAYSTGASGGFPSNTTSPVFLAGGSEGTTSQSDWQAGFNFLKQLRVNSIVCMSHDPAVHAALKTHIAYMAGPGKSERDGFVGLLNTAGTALPTKAEIKSQITALNTRHLRAFAQSVTKYNSAGERTVFNPAFAAAHAAGMQAGSEVGTSLTRKFVDVLEFEQDTSWNPLDDANEMINAGLLFMERLDGVGSRWVRNITTHLSSDNPAYTEGAVNEATNYAVYTFRNGMERFIGQKGFSGTVGDAKGEAINLLSALLDEVVITQHRSLDIRLTGDTMEISVELAPVQSINFIPITFHLVTASLTA